MNIVTLLAIVLEIDDRWGVGTMPNADQEISLPLIADLTAPCSDRGRPPHVPGTSLAGSLRSHLREGLRVAWLGSEPPAWEESTGDVKYVPSRLRLLGCLMVDGHQIASRGVTAVNARRRAAAGRTLRIEQWAHPGTIVVCAEHSGEPSPDLIGELRSWEPVIGRSASTGMGRAWVSSVRSLRLDLDKAEHLNWWLTDCRVGWFSGGAAPDGATESAYSGRVPHADRDVVLSIQWRVREPIHLGTGDADTVADVKGDNHERRHTVAHVFTVDDLCLVPGSSWKGIFRHRTAYILRSCGASETEVNTVQDYLFGATGHRGVLIFDDARTGVGANVRRTHAPIDRFTGGALEGGLHTLYAVERGVEFTQRIRVRVIPTRLPDEAAMKDVVAKAVPKELANLLCHVVRDCSDGLVGIGRGSSRGYGWIEAVGGASATPILLRDVLAAVPAKEEDPATEEIQ